MTELRTIRLTCRECGAARDVTRHYIQDAVRVREPGRITVDWERFEATHTCRSCTQRARMQADNQAIVKRHGRQGLREIRGRALAAWKAEHPEEHQAFGRTLAARRTLPERSVLDTARLALGHLRLELSGLLGLCLLCHRLIYTEAATVRNFQAEGREHVGRFHASCYQTWHQSDVMRAWVSACRRADLAGETKPDMPVPPRPSRRMSSAEELAGAYAATVRYFWQREESSRAARDDHGEIRSVVWLAGELGITRQGLRQRVERFLARLPDEAQATGRVKAWREVFLPLKAAETDAP